METTKKKMQPIAVPKVGEHAIPTDVIAPVERMRLFSDDQFESFIAEWAVRCIKPTCKDVYNFGGAGDKGRDVIAEFPDGTITYFQCKKYDHPLTPSEVYVEIGKLCYYTYTKEIPIPREYYFVAPYDAGPKLSGLLKEPDKVKGELIGGWNKSCSKKISENLEIKLEGAFEEYVKSFDFSILNIRSIHKIIDEYSNTPYFYYRFGGPTPPVRPASDKPPQEILQSENNYVIKAIRAIALSRSIQLSENILENSDIVRCFVSKQRELFFSAESLRRYVQDVFIEDAMPFDALKREVFSAVEDVVLCSYPHPEDRLRKTLSAAAAANTSSNILDYQLHVVKNDDRRGICHHLANDDIINWEVQDA